jgi:hypothetical protein
VTVAASRGSGDPGQRAVSATARLGFAARGALYGVVGLLALQLARGVSGEDASQQGAMDAVAAQPFGGFLLGVLAAGLTGYAVFRVVEAVRGRGDGSAFRRRVIPAARALANGLLAALAWQELADAGVETSESRVTARVLDLPGGELAIGGLGLVIAGVGAYQLHKAWSGDVHDLVDRGQLPPTTRVTVHVIGRLGHLGRAFAFGIAGSFLVRAAWTHDPDSGVGLDAALGEVVGAPLGGPLMVAVAVCLVLFGVHCAVEAALGRAERG